MPSSSRAMSSSLPSDRVTILAPMPSVARPPVLVRSDMPETTGSLRAESPHSPPAGRRLTPPAVAAIRPTISGVGASARAVPAQTTLDRTREATSNRRLDMQR
jgi:hypothetical protein